MKDTKTVHFDHVAIGCWKVGDATDIMKKLTALPKGNEWTNWEAFEFIAKQWHFKETGKIEIIQPNPDHADSFMLRFLKTHGAPTPHHITFKVPSIIEAREKAESLGFNIVGFNDSDPFWKEFFLHPKDAQGIVVQFAESLEGQETWIDSPDTWVKGLRLKSTDSKKSELIFKQLLQGKLEKKRDNILEFSWPTSSMKIFVEVDPQGSDGVDKILLSTFLDVQLDGGFEKIFEITKESVSKL